MQPFKFMHVRYKFSLLFLKCNKLRRSKSLLLSKNFMTHSITFRRLWLCMSDFSLLIHCLPIEQRITNSTMLKLCHKHWTGKGPLIRFPLHFLVINTREVWPGYHQLPKMKSLGLWLSILWVVALTRHASAEGELETGSEREKRKFTSTFL